MLAHSLDHDMAAVQISPRDTSPCGLKMSKNYERTAQMRPAPDLPSRRALRPWAEERTVRREDPLRSQRKDRAVFRTRRAPRSSPERREYRAAWRAGSEKRSPHPRIQTASRRHKI